MVVDQATLDATMKSHRILSSPLAYKENNPMLNRKMTVRKKTRRGFTLIEVLLVLAILVVVAGAVVINTLGVSDDAKKKFAKSEVSRLSNFVKTYHLTVGSLPSTLEALYTMPTDLADPSKWTAILDKPVGADPWNHAYEYKVTGSKFEIRSLGPDGQSNTEDDITS
jgi:general secretion pathway protein G